MENIYSGTGDLYSSTVESTWKKGRESLKEARVIFDRVLVQMESAEVAETKRLCEKTIDQCNYSWQLGDEETKKEAENLIKKAEKLLSSLEE